MHVEWHGHAQRTEVGFQVKNHAKARQIAAFDVLKKEERLFEILLNRAVEHNLERFELSLENSQVYVGGRNGVGRGIGGGVAASEVAPGLRSANRCPQGCGKNDSANLECCSFLH